MIVFELILGLILLLGGGEALVKGSVAAASRLGVSPTVIGLTLVGFGTSTPELVASLQAALLGSPGIAVGNVVGSNIANILLILGVSAVILPLAIDKRAFRRDGLVLLLATLAMGVVVLDGQLSRTAGTVFVALLAAFTGYALWMDRSGGNSAPAAVYEAEARDVEPKTLSLRWALLIALAGIVALVIGADFLVEGSIEVARAAGLSEAVIGLTMVAVGTSLPELVTSVMAAIRKHGDVAFGNIVGSNIFNILGIAGVTAIVRPIEVPAEIVQLDIWVMLLATLVLILFAMTGWRIGRREGAILLAGYCAYLALQFSPTLRHFVSPA